MAVLCFMLLLACCFDYSRHKVPNLLLAGMAAAGLAEAFHEGGAGVPFYLLKAVIVTGFLYPLFRIGTVGAGDVKLLGVCAGYFPGDRILIFLFFSMLVSAIFSLMKLWKDRNARERFIYLWEYVAEVTRTGRFRLYFEDRGAFRAAGICLSGPVLISALLHWGGVY